MEDHAKSVAYTFALMRDAYPQQFMKAYPNADSLNRARSLWLSTLKSVDPKYIGKAIISWIEKESWLPALADIKKAVERLQYLAIGMPEPLMAFYEARNQAKEETQCQWSHEAVEIAAKGIYRDIFLQESVKSAFSIFEESYRRGREELRLGHELKPLNAEETKRFGWSPLSKP